MDIVKPMFIVGVGRSGSSIFHEIFARHPNVSWLTKRCDKYPNKPQLNRRFMKMIDLPVINRFLPGNYPEECYPFWEYHCPGFRRPCRELFPEDVTLKSKKRIQEVFPELLTKKRNRLLVKITGWSRMGFINEIFSDAKFIHIVRDGRAVVNSMLNIHWWWGWRGPSNWRWGELTVAQMQEWNDYNKSFAVLGGIEWKILMDALENSKKYVKPENFLEIKYEDLCNEPVNIFKDVMEFCELTWSQSVENEIAKRKLANTNEKWKKELNPYQQESLNTILRDYLLKYGYQ